MFQRPKRTPRPPSTSSVDLGCIRISTEEVDDFCICDRIERVEAFDEQEILEWAWVEEGVWEGLVRVAVLGIARRGPFLLSVVVTNGLELV